MAGDAIIILENLLAGTGFRAHRFTVSGGSTAGVDRGRVQDEGNAKRAKYGSIIDSAAPQKASSKQILGVQCNEVVAEQGFDCSSKIQNIRILFRYQA